MQDMIVPAAHHNKVRRDWGNTNVVMLEGNIPKVPQMWAMQRIRQKVAKFIQRAIYPQQLTVRRDYVGIGAGAAVYKVLKGREIDGFREDGVRVVSIVYEDGHARFIMSPLHRSEFDARTWAKSHTGAE